MTEKTIPPLKPCPFCGSEQDIDSIDEHNCVVRCKNQDCVAEGPYELEDDGFPVDTHRCRIAAAWNRRGVEASELKTLEDGDERA